MICLADYYFEGKFVEKDFAKGWKWLEKAALINKGYGHYAMANVYREGKFVKTDKAKALEYYELAASEGFRVAEDFAKKLRRELSFRNQSSN